MRLKETGPPVPVGQILPRTPVSKSALGRNHFHHAVSSACQNHPMAAPQDPRTQAAFAGYEPLIAAALGTCAAVAMVAALAITLLSPERMLLIVLLYLTAFACAGIGARYLRSSGRRSNGLKMIAMAVVLACLISVVIWTVTDTWSLIGKCERREQMDLMGQTESWYEGTACTEAELDWRGY